MATIQVKAAPRGVLYALVFDNDYNLLAKPKKIRTLDDLKPLMELHAVATPEVQGKAYRIIHANSA